MDFLSHIESMLQITRTGYLEHFIIGIFISGLTSYFMFKKKKSKIQSFGFAFIFTIIAAICKEIKDYLSMGELDQVDIYITFVGAVVGSIFVLFRFRTNKLT